MAATYSMNVDPKLILSLVAASLALVGNVPYLKDTLKSKIRPHPFTWVVWTIVSLVTFFGQLQKGAGFALIATGAAEVFTIIIFFASLRNGFKHVRPVDTIFLAICILGLVPWYITDDPTISVIAVVFVDVMAYLPTLRKGYRHPDSEDSILYQMNIVRHILVLLSLGSYNLVTMLHSISMISMNSVMLLSLARGRKNGKPITNGHHRPLVS